MVTTGSKLYFGLAAVAAAVLAVLGWATRWAMQPTLGAGSALVAFLFLGSLTLYIRDNEATEPADEGLTPAPRHATWSITAALGAVLAIIGLPVDNRLFVAGLVLIGLSIIEWAVQAWADRASADPVYNERIRGRLMHPVEFPIAGALTFGFIVLGFSRLMAALSRNGAIVAFAVIGVIVMGIAALLGTRPHLTRKVLGGVMSVAAVAVVAGGITGAAHGFRTFEEHESACVSDHEGSKTATDKAGIAAVISYQGGGFSPDSFVAGRNAHITFVFKNLSDTDTKFVVQAGDQPKLDASGQPLKAADGTQITEPLNYCTYFVRPNTQSALTVLFPTPGTYQFTAEPRSGESGAEGKMIVP